MARDLAPGQAFDAADVLATLERDTDGLVVRQARDASALPGTAT